MVVKNSRFRVDRLVSHLRTSAPDKKPPEPSISVDCKSGRKAGENSGRSDKIFENFLDRQYGEAWLDLTQVCLTGRSMSGMMPLEKFAQMMHAVLSSATAAVLFIHAAFGCCWHHAHRCTLHDTTLAVADQAGCCKHHGRGDNHQQSKPCGCQIECDGTCAYLLPQKIRIDAPQSVASLDVVAALPAYADAQHASASWSDMCERQHGAMPPLRLHLLHQLLLN